MEIYYITQHVVNATTWKKKKNQTQSLNLSLIVSQSWDALLSRIYLLISIEHLQ